MLKFKRLFLVFLILLVILPLAFLYLNVGGFNYYLKCVEYYSNKYGIEKELVLSIIKTESNFNPKAVSQKGAVGIMQIMPKTAEFIASELKVSNYDLFDYNTSINFGVYYLSYLTKKYSNEHIVICSYNAGETRVNSWVKLGLLKDNETPYKETTNYLKRVKLRKKLYSLIVN
ncbi:MAG: lytic transglycosylase domain-containing protein [Clostridia bacterium]|nr:lytic transglycosylase domain-containing protein [Clostridia bacterium]